MSQRWKMGLLIWGAGFVGVVALTMRAPALIASLPAMLGREMPPLPFPLWVVIVLSLVQSAVLLALAVWSGVALSPPTGLRAPAFEAVASRQPLLPALRPQLVPGLLAGIFGGLALFGFSQTAPADVQAAQDRMAMPLAVRMLYGGMTEEILLRWGFMTLLVWLAWRFRRRGTTWMWVAIAVSALVFAAGHLPAAGLLIGKLTPDVVAWVLGVNTLFGIAFGASTGATDWRRPSSRMRSPTRWRT